MAPPQASPRRFNVLALVISLFGAATAYDNGSGYRLPPLGWNSWCTDDFCGLLDLCFEEEIHEIADAMVSSGLVAAGYKLLELDDCWAATNRSADGNLQPDPARFPAGIKALVQYVNARGMKLGLYTSAGDKTCKYGRPGSAGKFDVDAKWFAEQGVQVRLAPAHASLRYTPPSRLSASLCGKNQGRGAPVAIFPPTQRGPRHWLRALSSPPPPPPSTHRRPRSLAF